MRPATASWTRPSRDRSGLRASKPRPPRAAERSPAGEASGIVLDEIDSTLSEDGATRTYRHVELRIDTDDRVAHLTVNGPDAASTPSLQSLRDQGADAWSLRAFRELDDALLHLRFNHDTVGLVLLHTRGSAEAVAAHDAVLLENPDDWFAREVRLKIARVLRRIDNTARSMFAIVDPGSCFAGSLFELVLASDRSYMLDDGEVSVRVTAASGGAFPMSTGLTRLAARFLGDPEAVEPALRSERPLHGEDAADLGLVTLAPDDIDWEDEIRIAIEERVSLSPDALTGMEQNLRFAGAETCDSKIFGRLSAWQNWIFQRPNAVGEEGALTLYGHPTRPRFDWRRT